MSLLLLLLGCGADPAADSVAPELYAPPVTPAADAHLVPLDAPRRLRRLSLDLRGVLPTTEELDTIEADPTAWDTLRDRWLADPAFEERLVRLLGERWHTRLDEFLMYYYEYPELAHDPRNEYPLERAVGEEPLRLMAHVAATDAPWTEIVTADWSVVHVIVADLWPVDRSKDGPTWEVAHYTDDRPAAGVLATNGLWWRYFTTLSNMNRGRAAAVARLLLCEDYLSRPVSFAADAVVVGADGVESALRSNPYCMGCHSSLDPIASTLFGFYAANEFSANEADVYHQEREPYGESLLGLSPEWYGRPLTGLEEMGSAIATDPRFARCAAETAAELYWRRPLRVDDHDRVDRVLDAYEADGQRFKAAVRAATDAAVYGAGGLTADATDTERASENTVRLMDGPLLDTVLTELTGFDWVAAGFEVLDNDTYGYRVMAGGVDGEQVTRSQTTPSLTWSLTVRRAAEGAAQTATEHLGESGALLGGVTLETRPGDPAFDTTLDALHWRLYAERPTDAWHEEATALWEAAYDQHGASDAWRTVLVAMLRDPRFGAW